MKLDLRQGALDIFRDHLMGGKKSWYEKALAAPSCRHRRRAAVGERKHQNVAYAASRKATMSARNAVGDITRMTARCAGLPHEI